MPLSTESGARAQRASAYHSDNEQQSPAQLAGSFFPAPNPIAPGFESVRDRISTYLKPPRGSNLENLSRSAREEYVVEIIWQDLCGRGSFLHDDLKAYLFLDQDKRLIAIDGGMPCNQLLYDYGLLPGDVLRSKVREAIGMRASREGRKVDIFTVAHFDRPSLRHYLYLGNSRVIRTATDRIEEVENGTDGVLFRDVGQVPLELPLGDLPSLSLGLKVSDTPLCRALNANWAERCEDQHQLYLCVFFAMLLPEMFGSRPIVTFVGEHRSGKTTAALKPGWLLFGNSFYATVLNRNLKDVETALTNNYLTAFDNADTRRVLDEIQDLVATAATGGKISRRRLYTDNDLVDVTLKSHVTFTSRSTPFNRNDVVDRCLPFSCRQFDRDDGPAALGEIDVRQSVLEHRRELMAEVVVRVQNILRALAAEDKRPYNSGFRMKDFSRFCLAVAHHEGWLTQMDRILADVVARQRATSIEGDPLHALLRLWVGANVTMLDRPVTALRLHQDLVPIARRAMLEYNDRAAPNQLSRALGELKESCVGAWASGPHLISARRLSSSRSSRRSTGRLRS